MGKTLHEAYSEGNNPSQKSANSIVGLSEIGASQSAKSISRKEATATASQIRNSIENSNGFESMSEALGSNINKDILAEMFESTAESALSTGTGELAVFTMQEAM